MENETKFNVAKAAELAGVARQTIHKFIRTGKLSAEKTADGKTVIDKSELLRVFPSLATPGAPKPNSKRLHSETSQITAILQSQIERLERELDVIRQERDEERRARERDVDYYRREHDRLMSLIENSRLLPKPEKEKRGWLRRWFT